MVLCVGGWGQGYYTCAVSVRVYNIMRARTAGNSSVICVPRLYIRMGDGVIRNYAVSGAYTRGDVGVTFSSFFRVILLKDLCIESIQTHINIVYTIDYINVRLHVKRKHVMRVVFVLQTYTAASISNIQICVQLNETCRVVS